MKQMLINSLAFWGPLHWFLNPWLLLPCCAGVLRYVLECGVAGGDGSPEPGAAPIEFPSQGLAAVAGRPGLEMWVEEGAEGVIAAKASKQVRRGQLPCSRARCALARAHMRVAASCGWGPALSPRAHAVRV
jgi:hypothetical protein